ncbi:hypothetical protein [Mobilicoccus massiliensis]|uniref:hypothetical protein n=1 Tax=Mobilicoccus massiliensis TaxID=1522310 RepID=UPI00058BF640|nr:hypothetical protein [Mobilicoccus massiliensis]
MTPSPVPRFVGADDGDAIDAGLSLARVRLFIASDEAGRAALLHRHREDLARRMALADATVDGPATLSRRELPSCL